jgi:hypothetical protein
MANAQAQSDNATFLVDEHDLTNWRWDEAANATRPALRKGEIELRVDKFALSANNITYARLGKTAGYWKFFPAPPGWGIVPVWGFATVARSLHDELPEGERVYGFLPIARRAVLAPAEVSRGRFVDGAVHRQSLATTYNEYGRASQQPLIETAREDLHLVLRPLFALSFFLAAALIERDSFGADVVVVSSASSKTALGLGHILTRQERISPKVVGLTSAGQVEFVDNTRCFDAVLTYDELPPLVEGVRLVYVDIAGNRDIRVAVHSRYGDALVHSYRVGFTHWDADGDDAGLPGPQPEFFFTPTHIVQRRQQWGGRELAERIARSSRAFYDNAVHWLCITAATGPEAIEAAYARILSGAASPADGHVLMWQ